MRRAGNNQVSPSFFVVTSPFGFPLCYTVCCLIEKSSILGLPFHNDDVIDTWQNLIDDCLEHAEVDVQVSHVHPK